MAGFLSAYSGTERIEVGGVNAAGQPYWIEIKKCLTRAESEIAERLLSSATVVRGEGGDRTTDTAAYRTYLVVASVVDWNLDDEDGAVWQLNNDAAKRRNVARLPESVFSQVFARVDQLNGPPSPQQRSAFRDRSDTSDPGEQPVGRAGEPEQVRGGEVLVASPGPALG